MEDGALDVRAALEGLIVSRGANYADLSRMIGRNAAYIQQFIKRGIPRKLGERDRRLLASHFGVPEQLLGGMPADQSTSPRPIYGAISVPWLSLGTPPDSRAVNGKGRVMGEIAFDARWLRDLEVQPGRVAIARMNGEAMSPDIRDGDVVMVDHDDGVGRLRNGIYVLELDGVMMVKRISIGPKRGRFSLLCDNPHYPNWLDIDPALVNITGRVVWMGRSVR
ncbi:S24 family peptidase [Sphingobium cupriresistens]|uniref:Peptidase S24 n=1 Tax=Sphingobium cupriresistens LL01 TaxID=1420583 RepID=A0A0J7Y432_9SPHN|nr:S24 family peptidase [Sphingobium cupriresistens]KMS58589.1 peptidase S24 [Sphingobium cupriresistens LL01]